MDSKVNYAAVGLFVLVLGAALVAAVLWLASGGDARKRFDHYLVIVNESVSGLNTNAPVKYMGVEVGKVREIRLDASNPERVLVLLAIQEDTPIKRDTEAVLKTQGFTGIAYVELSGGSADAPPLTAPDGEYPVIASKPSLSARLENVMSSVLANVDRTTRNVNALLDEENMAAVKSTLRDVSALAHTLAAQKDAINTTLGNVSQASQQITPLIQRVARTSEAVERMANEAGTASRKAGTAVDAAGAGMKRLSGETLPEVERLLAELNELSASLRRLTDQTERNPAGFLLGRQPTPPGPGE